MFAAEESPRFKAGNRFGSRALVGRVSVTDAYRLQDENGVTLAQAMRQVGLDPDSLALAQTQHSAIGAFIELHIEQGTALQALGIPVGVVTSLTGTRRYQVEIIGRADHSGGTPRHARRDALAAAAQIILDVERAAHDIGGSLVATVTTLHLEPNAMNVVPGMVRLGIDVRDIQTDTLERATEALRHTLKQVAQQRGVETTLTMLRNTPPTQLSPRLRAAIAEAGARAGIPTVEVPSHTGHDVISMSAIA
ncbi:MAG TPA: hydantoinase/carbamoylase family amidase [Anaerolineae bacterium]|nr:hydantoinase/carbamoylase family amidase [Anaerolineae bacterium]